MSPRRYLLPLLALFILTAGCLSGGPGGGVPTTSDRAEGVTPTDDRQSDRTPTVRPTDERTATDWQHAADQPAPNKTVVLENRWNDNVTVDVRVIRSATGKTVHNASYELTPGAKRQVYETSEADPDGIERFTIVVSARNQTESVSIETSQCYGHTRGMVDEGGDLNVFYAVC